MIQLETRKEQRIAELRVALNQIQNDSENEEMMVEGYALTFNTPTIIYETEDGGKFWEIISPEALDEADLTDVVFRYNHKDGIFLMARTQNKTLRLTKDAKGLYISANLAPTTGGKDLYTLIKRGDITKMSFAFTVAEDYYNIETKTRTILKIKKLYDVAAVDIPAYETTSINARSQFDKLADEQRRKKALLMSYCI